MTAYVTVKVWKDGDLSKRSSIIVKHQQIRAVSKKELMPQAASKEQARPEFWHQYV